MFFANENDDVINLTLVFFVIAILFLNFCQKYITIKYLSSLFEKFNKYFSVTFSIIVVLVCIILSKGSSEKFIYFNF